MSATLENSEKRRMYEAGAQSIGQRYRQPRNKVLGDYFHEHEFA
jgi:hypothetical protein